MRIALTATERGPRLKLADARNPVPSTWSCRSSRTHAISWQLGDVPAGASEYYDDLLEQTSVSTTRPSPTPSLVTLLRSRSWVLETWG